MESITSEDQLKTNYTLVGFCMTMVVNIILSFQFQKFNNIVLKILSYQPIDKKIFLRIIIISVFILTTPLLCCITLILSIYKNICGFILKKRNKRFVKFLNSLDVFWNLEDEASTSVINVLGIIHTTSADKIAMQIKEKLLLLQDKGDDEKIFYKKGEAFGFYYWEKSEIINIDDYVKIIDNDETKDISLNNLEVIISNASKHSLPYNNKGLFQILITRQKLANKETDSHGIIIRINHAVGDGVALFNFLCKNLADQDTIYANKTLPKEGKKGFTLKDLLDVAICFADGILRDPDENILHGPTLTGYKIFKWIGDDDKLLEVIKSIKDNCHGVKFTDVLATALSYGLNDLFAKKTKIIPTEIATVLPVRFTNPLCRNNSGMSLENDFSVAILDVPIRDSSLENINERCKKMRKSLDPVTNYYFLKLACQIFPRQVLKPLLNSSQATLILSNLPGPDSITICGGTLKELIFFVPHKGNTGICVTSLCYGGVLRLAIMADTALITDGKDLQIILEGMKEGLQVLHSKHVK